MVKHTQTICWLLLANSVSVFDNFVELAQKGLNYYFGKFILTCYQNFTPTHFMPVLSFYTPWKLEVLWCFQRVIERAVSSDIFKGYGNRKFAWKGLIRLDFQFWVVLKVLSLVFCQLKCKLIWGPAQTLRSKC